MKPDYTHLVGNHSSRGGVNPRLITVHTTEGSNHPGITDLRGLGDLFDSPSSEASSTVANDGDGNDARFVRDEDKAWTQAADNSFCLSIEQIGFASTTREDWFHKYPHQLANTARWIAYWSEKWNIPIRRGAAPAGTLLRSGVASHKQLGILGGGHSDPGPGYPFRYVLLMARYFHLVEHGHAKAIAKVRGKVNRIRKHYGLPAVP